MAQFCGTSFFDEVLWSRTTYPDTSPCFQKVVFFILPSVFLMVVSTCRLYHLYYSKKRGYGHHWLATIQTILSVCLVVPALADMFRTFHDMQKNHMSYPIDYVMAILRTVAMVLAAVIIQMERIKGGRYFGGLFTYWFLLTFTGVFVIYSKIRLANEQGFVDDVFRMVTFAVYYVLVLVQLALSFVPNPYITVHEKSSPELQACFASRLTFWWFNDLLIRGYKKPLQDSDLFELNDVDRAGAWVPKFEKCWQLDTGRCSASRKPTDNGVIEVPTKELEELTTDGKTKVDNNNLVRKGEDVALLPNKQREVKRASLLKCLAKVFLPSILICASFKLLQDVCLFVGPLLLKAVIRFVKEPDEPDWRGYLYAVIMFIFAVLQSMFLHQYFYRATIIGMRLRSTICASVYNKAMKLTAGSRKESTAGEIVNLMSVDAQRFMDLMTYFNTIWSGPFQITVSLVMLWQILGPSVLAGLLILILLIPLNIFVGNIIKKLQVKQMEEKDKRIKLMSEILNGIKVLKLYAWEESFCNIINKIRQNELDLLKKAGYINAFSSFVFQLAPFFVTCCSFAVYVLSDDNNVLDAEKAFAALALFNIMKFPLAVLPHVITSIIQTLVSVKRVAKFLSLEELDPGQIDRTPDQVNAISIVDCSFTWKDAEDDAPTLSDLSLNIAHGELVAVVGVVGSGKSSLISALLGDMHKLKGQVSVSRSVAYVSQQAWIQNATLRDNILFGSEFDQEWYDKVLDACALRPDLTVLPAADLTEIGEKGINLSGGQKQRVSLARAVYSKADIYYLDDPLSAVDAHVGKHIFENVIGHTGCLKGKTRVLVTHGISFLRCVDTILVIKDGRLSERGSFQQLLDHAGAFSEFLRAHILEESECITEADLQENSALLEKMSELIDEDFGALVRERLASIASMDHRHKPSRKLDVDVHSLRSAKSALSVAELQATVSALDVIGHEGGTAQLDYFGSASRLHVEDVGESNQPVDSKGVEVKDKLIQEETSKEGRVNISVFKSYLAAMGWISVTLVVLLFTADLGMAMGSGLWLSKWSDDVDSFNTSSTRNMYLGIYASFGVIQGVFALAAMLSLAIGSWLASRGLHRKILDNIVRCSINFFDTTPMGRILNRFSKDMDVVDNLLSVNIRSLIWCALSVLFTLIIISISTPWFLLVVIPLAVIYVIVQRFYVASSRQLKRIESVNLSPIYSHFDESIRGAATIRAYDKQQTFMKESLLRVDKHQQAYYPILIANRWLSVRLELVGSFIVLAAVTLAVISRNVDSLDITAGMAGLSITYSLTVTNTLNWLVRMTSELESNVVAVERIKEYTELPQEADWVISINRPPTGWPSVGSIVFENYSVRYREGLDLVLKNISCTINGGEKIGICGRTGAGKSSLTLALFRILEGVEGAIYVDDVRIGAIGLHDLRSALTIIPQDPVVFSGSLRMNLDPFEKNSDEKLWEVLEQVNLKTFVQSLSEGLDFTCTEGGDNLSVGQKQLICLARALLRHTKVLILDEATAAVDLETDDLIQATIKTAFSDCTVLTIAHRLNTIMDYDRIMVLDKGEMKEFAPPQQLLSDKSSIFYALAKQANITS